MSNTQGRNDVWPTVWSLAAPPKIWAFAWWCSRNTLALRHNLRKRKVPCTGECGLCSLHEETEVYLFFKCEFARVFWFVCWLQLDIHRLEEDDFLSIWWSMVNSVKGSDWEHEVIQMFAFGLWRLWKYRNLAVFEGTIMDLAEVVSCLLHQVAEFQDVQRSDQTPSTTLALVTPSLNVGWHKPPVLVWSK